MIQKGRSHTHTLSCKSAIPVLWRVALSVLRFPRHSHYIGGGVCICFKCRIKCSWGCGGCNAAKEGLSDPHCLKAEAAIGTIVELFSVEPPWTEDCPVSEKFWMKPEWKINTIKYLDVLSQSFSKNMKTTWEKRAGCSGFISAVRKHSEDQQHRGGRSLPVSQFLVTAHHCKKGTPTGSWDIYLVTPHSQPEKSRRESSVDRSRGCSCQYKHCS